MLTNEGERFNRVKLLRRLCLAKSAERHPPEKGCQRFDHPKRCRGECWLTPELQGFFAYECCLERTIASS